MATTSPGASLKETAAIAGICGPGTMTVNASAEISPVRGGNRVGRASVARARRASSSR
jgi:hypothetical protein